MFSAGLFGDLGFNSVTASYNDGLYRLVSDLHVVYGIAKEFKVDLEVSWQVWGSLPVIVGNNLDIAYSVIGGIRSDIDVPWQIRNVRQTDLTVTWFVQGDTEPVVVKRKVCVPKAKSKTIKIC